MKFLTVLALLGVLYRAIVSAYKNEWSTRAFIAGDWRLERASTASTAVIRSPLAAATL